MIIRVETWLADTANRNLSPYLTHRRHVEGWCVVDEPYGDRVGPQRTFAGNANDFECTHCGKHFRRVMVEPAVARVLLTVNEEAFKTTGQGMESVDRFVTSDRLYGCDCFTGYEHQQRGCTERPSTGNWANGLEVLALVYGEFDLAVTDEQMDAQEEPHEETIAEEAPVERDARLFPLRRDPSPLSDEASNIYNNGLEDNPY